MDHHGWLWRRKSSEKSSGETESLGSASSHSERYSDDQDALRASPDNASPNHVQSPEAISNISDSELRERFKSLTEKLSAALLNISAKEDLVKQHAKVAEEAVSGWEKAETEVTALKQQLEAAAQKNSALEDRISHLDGALKECVKQLRQSREEQEQKLHDALAKKSCEWESDKSELENRLVELQAQLEASKSEVSSSIDSDLNSKLETLAKENLALKLELLARSKDLEMRTLERDFSIQSAETASKQHLESIRRVTKLESECRKLRAMAHKTSSSSTNDYKPPANSLFAESLTDSQSDSAERLLGLDNEPCCSDSWASALISELDQFKNDKASTRNLTTSVEIDLMDDFLEMERLVGLPDADHRNSSFELGHDSCHAIVRDSGSKIELEAMEQQMAWLEEKVKKMENEKVEMEMALADTRSRLEDSCIKLLAAENKLVDTQKQLELATESKQAAAIEIMTTESEWKESESQLKSCQLEIEKLREMAGLLERKLEEERVLSAEFSAEVKASETTRTMLECQLESACADAGKLHEKLGLLEEKLEEERAISAGVEAKAEALEATRWALESQLESAHLDAWDLRDKVVLLERKLEEERTLALEFSVIAEAMEAKRKELELQLESANLEVEKLCNKVGFLEGKVEEEKASSTAFAEKCQNLENELNKKKQGAELQRAASSNGELKIKQEKELAIAADKLAECQKTIASLGWQLKSLTNLDDFALEAVKPEVNECFPARIGHDVKDWHSNYSSENLGISTFPGGGERGSPPSCTSSSSSSSSGLAKLLSQSRSSRIENQ